MDDNRIMEVHVDIENGKCLQQAGMHKQIPLKKNTITVQAMQSDFLADFMSHCGLLPHI